MTRSPQTAPLVLVLLASAGLGMAGCADTPLAPSSAVPTVPTALSGARIGLDDAAQRLAPSLDRLLDSSALQDALKAANAAIARGDARALGAALDHADRLVTRLAGEKHEAAAADLDALRLSLTEARDLLSSMSNDTPTPVAP
jgi:hypothetical protein